ncbi:DUF1552 domain-containing protein [Singulisphaera sp. Ch08]|uniref:DUF1552 domain-containing protein n=1 Tax=Singulisphaera sp. Ch08 TaxID=3120278 RepID=A0AAU7CE77_9BACT
MSSTNPGGTDPIAPSRCGRLSRRHLLRGLGVAVALPVLASLRPTARFASRALPVGGVGTTPTGAPLRAAFVYVPNGAIPAAWWPKGEETNYQLSRSLQALEPIKGLIQVLGGLDHQTADSGPNGVDGSGEHARANGTFLTGVRLKKSATDIHAGISIDQVLARQIGPLTRFASLELGCDAVRKTAACDSGYSCAYQYNLSWSSPTTPVTPESNPRLVFERLFGTGAPAERQANRQRRRQEQRSLLDFVLEDARSMQRRLNPQDRDKLDQYLSSVREIETGIERAEQFGAVQDLGVETPAGIPADYTQYVQLMYDMLFLAFQTDSTRVASFLVTHEGSNLSFDHIGVSEGHHDLSHHQNRPDWVEKVVKIDSWYVQQFARFLAKLEATNDADGNSLLFNSMIVYGSGCADGNTHTHTNLPFLLAGAGGGTLTPGRYVNYGSKPATNLFLDMADRLGISRLERFGDSTGRLANI